MDGGKERREVGEEGQKGKRRAGAKEGGGRGMEAAGRRLVYAEVRARMLARAEKAEERAVEMRPEVGGGGDARYPVVRCKPCNG